MSAWWQDAVFYQIYPRSFADSNGDGIGDIPGIISKLDYLKGLGITALWLSPHFPSPMYDCGYDISDYETVAPEYGTLDDFKRLLDEAHGREMRIVIDLVMNHTSHEHAWFAESRSSKDNPKRDWYIWKAPSADGGAPNNWESTFGGSAWEYDEATGQYYYHFFLKQQPDLNWRNPEVKQAMFDMARFWLDMGVDGFRLDAIGTIYEDPAFTPHASRFNSADFLRYGWSWDLEKPEDLTETAWIALFGKQTDLPEVHDLMKEFRQVIDEYEDRVLIGETEDKAFLGNGDDELHTLFNFRLMDDGAFTAAHVRKNRDLLKTFPANSWLCNTLNNHDASRAMSRYTDGGPNSMAQAILAAATMLMLPGTPVLYNGEEIGMSNYPPKSWDEVRDMLAVVMRDLERAAGSSEELIFDGMQKLSRDRCRTPMQWANSANGGFSPDGVKTWLPVNSDYAKSVNVADQEADSASLLNTYRRLIAVRGSMEALLRGDFGEVSASDAPFLVFTRRTRNQTVVVALNYSDQAQVCHARLPGRLKLLFSTHAAQGQRTAERFDLAPFEVFIAEVLY